MYVVAYRENTENRGPHIVFDIDADKNSSDFDISYMNIYQVDCK